MFQRKKQKENLVPEMNTTLSQYRMQKSLSKNITHNVAEYYKINSWKINIRISFLTANEYEVSSMCIRTIVLLLKDKSNYFVYLQA